MIADVLQCGNYYYLWAAENHFSLVIFILYYRGSSEYSFAPDTSAGNSSAK